MNNIYVKIIVISTYSDVTETIIMSVKQKKLSKNKRAFYRELFVTNEQRTIYWYTTIAMTLSTNVW